MPSSVPVLQIVQTIGGRCYSNYDLFAPLDLEPLRLLWTRHFAGYSRFSHFVFVVLPDLRIFVRILYQCAASFDIDVDAVFAALVGYLKADGVNPAAIADREVARGLRTGIEMLVEPPSGRTVNTSLLPFYFHDALATTASVRFNSQLLRPEQNVSR